MDLLVPMLDNYESLITVIEATKGKSELEVGYVGGNAASLIIKINKEGLKGRNLSNCVIKGADFSNASLQGVNFTRSHIVDSLFARILGRVCAVAFSPDNTLLATGDSNGRICLWEVTTGKELFSCKGHRNWVRSVSFSYDGQILASSSDDKTIKLWHIHTGECLKTLLGHTDIIRSVSFSPKSQSFVSGSRDGTIKLWDVQSGKCLKTLQSNGWVRSVAFSPVSPILASSDREMIRLCDISSGVFLRTLQEHTASIWSVTFSPNGQILASGGDDDKIKLWDTCTGKCIKTCTVILTGYVR